MTPIDLDDPFIVKLLARIDRLDAEVFGVVCPACQHPWGRHVLKGAVIPEGHPLSGAVLRYANGCYPTDGYGCGCVAAQPIKGDDWIQATTIPTSTTPHHFVPHFDLRDRCVVSSSDAGHSCFRFKEDVIHGGTEPGTAELIRLREAADRFTNLDNAVTRRELFTTANEYARKARAK